MIINPAGRKNTELANAKTTVNEFFKEWIEAKEKQQREKIMPLEKESTQCIRELMTIVQKKD